LQDQNQIMYRELTSVSVPCRHDELHRFRIRDLVNIDLAPLHCQNPARLRLPNRDSTEHGILPTYEQGTWADEIVVPVRNIVPMSDEADPLQLSMIGINPATAYLLLPGDWIGQTAANSAMGQYIIKVAKLAGSRR
jgi:D-arabinose 1-dehydrogenase-like Zn-dependent alcohol dehydrogenase